MNKKEPLIIALDMDGTLLNDKKRISLLTLFYLRKLTKQGHKILLCSGRPVRSMIGYYNKLKLSTPMVCYNGAYVFSPKDPNFKPVLIEYPNKAVIELIKKFKKHTINIMCESNEEIWVDEKDEYLNKFFWFRNMNMHVGNIESTLDKNTMTFVVHTTQEYKKSTDIDDILKDYPGIGVSRWTGSPYFELHHVGVTKGSQLENIANYYNIPRSNVIAIGDAANDYEMFDFAETSILMVNAKKRDYKTTIITSKDNNHNGIYHALKQLLK